MHFYRRWLNFRLALGLGFGLKWGELELELMTMHIAVYTFGLSNLWIIDTQRVAKCFGLPGIILVMSSGLVGCGVCSKVGPSSCTLPTKFLVVENCWNILFLSENFHQFSLPENSPFRENIEAKLRFWASVIFSVGILLGIFIVRRKLATLSCLLILTDDPADFLQVVHYKWHDPNNCSYPQCRTGVYAFIIVTSLHGSRK